MSFSDLMGISREIMALIAAAITLLAAIVSLRISHFPVSNSVPESPAGKPSSTAPQMMEPNQTPTDSPPAIAPVADEYFLGLPVWTVRPYLFAMGFWVIAVPLGTNFCFEPVPTAALSATPILIILMLASATMSLISISQASVPGYRRTLLLVSFLSLFGFSLAGLMLIAPEELRWRSGLCITGLVAALVGSYLMVHYGRRLRLHGPWD